MQCFENLFPSRENYLQVIILGLAKELFKIKLNIVLIEQFAL